MSRSACVFIIVFLYGECSGNSFSFNETAYFSYEGVKSVNKGPPPNYWDWRDHNMVTPVKNQLDCNACWAFSTVAGIESHIKIYKDQTVTLSEQFLLDCEKSNAGCSSASILKTFAHIVSDLGGVLLDEDYYKYTADKLACRWPGKPLPVPVVGFRRVFPNEDDIARCVYQYGPVSAGINSASMAKYETGIDQPTKEECSPDKLNHAILIVGYNVYVSPDGKKSIPYWIIKNSWGEEWGDKGFYYLERGRNACGIASDVSFPFVQ